MSDKRYPTRMHEVLGVATEERFTYSEYAIDILKALKSLGYEWVRVDNQLYITHNEGRMALKHITMVKRDVDDAYQEILSIFESTNTKTESVSKTERVDQKGSEPGGEESE